ncbi:PREDICTED: trichohyalin-like [Drosophila arizonae]|uniref:Trichohyalin-like n=1 Tax=Drosophila arizonae TaxID=7263 RepID=A0ABM1PP46_DROAR|nr:PREDICTED: trichohyalin-like [Drosophila arizonae]
MRLNKACAAEPVSKKLKRTYTGFRPVVLSAERYDGIVGRSVQRDSKEQLEALAEEQRYAQYLQNGHAVLLRRFTNMPDLTGKNDEELLAARDKILAEATKNRQTQELLEKRRKQRIMRANQLLTMLKPGPRGLHAALIESETIYQRKYHDELNAEIAEKARRQELLDEQQCPQTLIPFGCASEEQDTAQQLAKAKEARCRYLEAIEAKRQLKEAEREQNMFDSIVEREQYKCIQEKERQKRKELAEKKREFCRNAYQESLKEKAAKARFEAMADSVNDRIICVDKTAHRYLDSRYNNQMQENREQRMRHLAAAAQQHCLVQRAKQQQQEQQRERAEQSYKEAEETDELKRKLHIENLSKERRQYEQEYLLHRGDKAQRLAEIRRFELASRLKNENANAKFAASVKRKQNEEAAELRKILLGQRDEFLAQREEELMRTSACAEDPHLEDDFNYFAAAAKAMEESKAQGRPLYPIAKAAERYRRDIQLDMVPQGQVVHRRKIRDYCWPGYVSKAQLAYRKYEHRERCKIEQEKVRRDMFDNCLKITKMAAEERPFEQCVQECPMKLMQHRGMPAIASQESIELPAYSCEESPLPAARCPSNQNPSQELKCAPTSARPVPQPGEDQQSTSFKTALSNSDTAIQPAPPHSQRAAAGRDRSLFTMRRSNAKRPDLTRCWTSPPQTKTKATNIPAISLINQKCAAQQSLKPFWPAKLEQCD